MEFHSELSSGDMQSAPNMVMATFQTFFDAVFNPMDDSVIRCDNEGYILQMNTAALQLFNIRSNDAHKRMTCLDIFRQYEWHDEEDKPFSFDRFQHKIAQAHQTAYYQKSHTVVLSQPKYRKTFQLCYSFVLDPQKHTAGMMYIFHDTTAQQQKEKQKNLLNQSITTLVRAALSMPDLLNITFDKKTLPIPTGISAFGQYLVDVTRQLLECERVLLLGIGPDKRIYYISTSGLTTEQRLRRVKMNGQFSLDDFFDRVTLTSLAHHDFVVLTYDQISLPFEDHLTFDSHAVILGTPILRDNQLIGIFASSKNDPSYHYTEEEIFFTQSLSEFLTLLLISTQTLCTIDKGCAKAMLHNEADVLINSFLTSASHELRTPLTVVTGNIQLAQRRLQALLHQLSTQADEHSTEITTKMEKVQRLLTYADRSASTLDVLLDTIISDVQIHQGKFVLTMHRFDLNKLLKDVVERLQKQHPEVNILLQIAPDTPTLFLLADQRRIEQVMTIYIINAITHAPQDRPMVIQTERLHETICVSVSDEGPAIPTEKQQDVWKRFSHPWADMPIHDTDWNLGLGLSLCREIIQAHRGQVGFNSEHEYGVTFWFTLPLTKDDQDTPCDAQDA